VPVLRYHCTLTGGGKCLVRAWVTEGGPGNLRVTGAPSAFPGAFHLGLLYRFRTNSCPEIAIEADSLWQAGGLRTL